MYHIYFLVILMWFYLLFPFWRLIMKTLENYSLCISLPLLAAAQIWLYKASAHFWSYPNWIVKHDFLYNLVQFRLNYFPFFYLFVFLLGGLIAGHYEAFLSLLRRRRAFIYGLFFANVAVNAHLFYDLYYNKTMPPENIVNTLQQLSLPGFCLTITTLLFFCSLFDTLKNRPLSWVESLSQNSFFIYLIHPLVMNELILRLSWRGIPLKSIPIIPYYLSVLLIAWGGGILWHKTKKRFT